MTSITSKILQKNKNYLFLTPVTDVMIHSERFSVFNKKIINEWMAITKKRDFRKVFKRQQSRNLTRSCESVRRDLKRIPFSRMKLFSR